MIDQLRVLGLISARGGSKRLPRKNLRTVGGLSLLEWTIRTARQSQYLDRLVLSSDNEDIIATAKAAGCDVPFVRPSSLSTDDATSVDCALHALGQLDGFDYVVLLQPTSPLRLPQDIDGAIEKCVSQRAPSCVSVTAAGKLLKLLCCVAEHDQVLPVQSAITTAVKCPDSAIYYIINGAVYVASIDRLRSTGRLVSAGTVAYEMPEERSIDIDTERDLALCEFINSGGGTRRPCEGKQGNHVANKHT